MIQNDKSHVFVTKEVYGTNSRSVLASGDSREFPFPWRRMFP